MADKSVNKVKEKEYKDTKSIELALRERVKELECLYTISSEIESAEHLEQALQNSIQHLVDGFQFPEITTANITVDDLCFGDCKAKEQGTFWILKEDIIVNKKKRGAVSVFYHREEEFLQEEVKLLKEISSMIARAVEKQDLKNELKESIGKLEVLVKEKTLEVEESNRQNKALQELTEALDRSKKKLQTFFTAITDIIIVIDKAYTISLSNKPYFKNGDKCYSRLFGMESMCPFCPAERAFNDAYPLTIETRVDHKYYLLQAYPIINKDGKVVSVLEKCSDITKEKQLEFQLIQSYKLASLGKLVAGVAHEINNPNTFIRGNLKIIKEALNDILPILDQYNEKNPGLTIARLQFNVFEENIPVLVDDMINGVNRIKKIVDGLRNFARKNEGLLDDDIDINSIVYNCLRLIENQIRRSAEVKLDLAQSIPLFKGNFQKLEQVLVNMVINASQAIKKQQGIITIKTDYNEKKKHVFLSIKDNGSGIDESALKYIFDPFFTTKRDRGGTGLGLSISYGIIKEHNGNIEVESQKGKGTTFKIFIPVTQDIKNETNTGY